MLQFSKELTDFIYVNGEKMGLDTPEKWKQYPMIVTNIVNIVDATYRRAIMAGERESLKTARVVTQSQSVNQMPMVQPNKKVTLNPRTWV